MDKWLGGWMDEWISGWMNGCIIKNIYGWKMDGRTIKWMDG